MCKTNDHTPLANDNRELSDIDDEVNRLKSGEVSFSATVSRISDLLQKGAQSEKSVQTVVSAEYSQAEILTDALAMCPAKTFDDLAQKVEAWMMMSAKDSMDAEQASCDEMLAYSIMEDIRRFAI